VETWTARMAAGMAHRGFARRAEDGARVPNGFFVHQISSLSFASHSGIAIVFFHRLVGSRSWWHNNFCVAGLCKIYYVRRCHGTLRPLKLGVLRSVSPAR
jgi:hypothetical protein